MFKLASIWYSSSFSSLWIDIVMPTPSTQPVWRTATSPKTVEGGCWFWTTTTSKALHLSTRWVGPAVFIAFWRANMRTVTGKHVWIWMCVCGGDMAELDPLSYKTTCFLFWRVFCIFTCFSEMVVRLASDCSAFGRIFPRLQHSQSGLWW